MNIYMIGYMGSGKSTVGELLADALKLDFIDLDKYIEKKTKKTIADIFKTEGEKKFRLMEHNCLKKLILKNNIVLALGGGTPCFYNNIHLINSNGISVYLKMDAESLVKRLVKEKNKRPIISGLAEKQLTHFITTHLKKREPIYLKASYTVQGKNTSPEEITARIRKIMEK